LESRSSEFGSPKVSFSPPLPFPLSPPLPFCFPHAACPRASRALLARAPRPGRAAALAPTRWPPASPSRRAAPRPPRAPLPRSRPGEPSLSLLLGRACPGPDEPRRPRRPRAQPRALIARPRLRALGRAPARARASATRVSRVCTARVPSARATRSRACDHSRTALNPMLIYFNLCSRRAVSRAS
jgi:hypothetical protein